MNQQLTAFKKYLTGSIDGRVLGLFRVLFGLVMVMEMIYYIHIDLVKNMYVLPSVQFSYDGFTWLKPLSEPMMDGIVWILLGFALLMTLGFWFKWAARLFAIGYSYLFLLDKSIYNNHIYLYILLAIMLSFTDADQFLAVRKRKELRAIPRWQQWIFQFQIVIVYFFAGVVKLKYDWFVLHEPVKTMLKNIQPSHYLFGFAKLEWVEYFFVYGGVLLDLASPLLLWHKPIRKWAIYLFVLFHITNSQIFDDIAFFPVAMLSTLIIFYEWSSFPKWIRSLMGGDSQLAGASRGLGSNRWLWAGYFGIQLLFPLRGFFLPNDLDWTTIGNRFSWRVKMDTRSTYELEYYVHFGDGQISRVDINSFVNTHQMRLLSHDPRAVQELAIAIKRAVIEQGGSVKAVKARIILARNGRPPQLFIDPEVDLTRVHYSPLKKLEWVVPFRF